MPKLRTLGSSEIIKAMESFGFVVVSQRGSHIKMSRQTLLQKQVLTIPNNKELPKGTLKAVFNQASRFVSGEDLQKFFYTE